MSTNGEKLLVIRVLDEWERLPGRITVLDVGANVGEWTCLLFGELRKRGIEDRADIHAFEPVPSTFQALKRRISKLSSGTQIRAVRMALSSRPGRVPLFVVGENAGTNSLHPDPASDAASVTQAEATTADLYAQENDIDLIHMVKCDAEGHDMEVIVGAHRLFRERRVIVWQFEYNYRWISARHYLRDAFEFARDVAYSLGKLTPDGIELYEAWHPELERFVEGNYVLIETEALNWLRARRGRFDEYGTWVARA